MTKTCTKCGETKPKSEFHKAASMCDGLFRMCKTCSKIYDAARYVANPGKRKASAVKWRAANPDRVKASAAKWYAANRDKCKASMAKWLATNPEKNRANSAKYAAANPEKERARKTKWCAANPEACRIYAHNRRANKRAIGGKLSKGLADKLFKLQRGKCACGCKQPLGNDYHMDHIIPLALGGSNTDDNMQLLRSTCNLQKHAKHPIDFMQQRGFLC